MSSEAQRTILAIDDDRTNLTILKAMFRKMDFELILENDPEKGIEIALQERPDIILLDIMMPGIDGFEVCRRLKSDSRTNLIPVIFLSARQDEADIIAGLELGAVDYLTKPLQLGELKARIGTVCSMLSLQEKLISQANTDQLTSIPNRLLLMDRLQTTIERSKREKGGLFALLYLDLDHFKEVNDNLGHEYGDLLLIEVARRIENSVRSMDTVARLGGDEFTVLLDGIEDFSEAITITERIQQEINRPMELKNKIFSVGSSVGIVVSASGEVTPEVILRDADTAMYRAKDMGKNCYQLFDPTMQEQVQSRLDLKQSLQRAIEREEFIVHYQPIVSLQTGVLRGFEALLRWQDPERGLIPPLDFVPLCEETGLIVPIGQWVLEEAWRQLSQWHEKYSLSNPLSISVNLSVKQLACEDIVEQIRRVLNTTGLDPNCLTLEITESMLIKNPALIVSTLQKIKALSVGLSMDDFGTGYSSLSYLHQLPMSTLKVDRSFINRIMNDGDGKKMVQTIVWLSQHLGLSTVAEGIETAAELSFLKEIGCEYGQGYYFSKPLASEDAEQLIQQAVQMEKEHIVEL